MKRCVAFLSTTLLAGAIACTSSGTPNPNPGAADAATSGPADARPDLVLPFAVDDYYAPSGYMGDGEQPGAIEDDEACGGQRGGDARGVCHRFTWDPRTAGWAGVFWQFPEGNWGTMPGLNIPAGATQVSFYAWGAAGGEVVSFMAGMGDVDGFEVKNDLAVLTTTPAKYTMSLSDTGYGVVVGGFGWVAEKSTEPVVFHIDDIVWE